MACEDEQRVSLWDSDASPMEEYHEIMSPYFLNPFVALGGDNNNRYLKYSSTVSVFAIIKNTHQLALVTGENVNWHGPSVEDIKELFDMFHVSPVTNDYVHELNFKFDKHKYYTTFNNIEIVSPEGAVIQDWNGEDIANANLINNVQFLHKCLSVISNNCIKVRKISKDLKFSDTCILSWMVSQHSGFIKYKISKGGNKYGILQINIHFVPPVYFRTFFLKFNHKFVGNEKVIIHQTKGTHGTYRTNKEYGHLPNQLIYNIYNKGQRYNELGPSATRHRDKNHGISLSYNPSFGSLSIRILIESKYPGSREWHSLTLPNNSKNIIIGKSSNKQKNSNKQTLKNCVIINPSNNEDVPAIAFNGYEDP